MRRPIWRERTSRSLWWGWGLPVLWMVVISGFSTDFFSATETGRFLLPLLRWLLPGASPASLELLHAVVRKSMHVSEFAILALLWYHALRGRVSGSRSKAALAAFFLAVGFGALDETHQLLVPSRTPSIVDVGWDSLGAALGVIARHLVQL